MPYREALLRKRTGARHGYETVTPGIRNRLPVCRVGRYMRRRLTLLLALAAPFVLAGCGKGKY